MSLSTCLVKILQILEQNVCLQGLSAQVALLNLQKELA